MAQDYKLTAFEKSDFQDSNGNYWCTAVFEGVGEPVKWVVKDPTRVSVGDIVYGEIKDWTSTAGKIWPRFYRQQKDDRQAPSGHSDSGKSNWQPRDDEAIRAQWALNQAREYLTPSIPNMRTKDEAREKLVEWGRWFYQAVDSVKQHDEQTAAAQLPPPSEEPIHRSDDFADQPIDLADIPF